MLGDVYYGYKFIVYYHNMYKSLPEFKITGDDGILIFLPDEKGIIPLEICEKFFGEGYHAPYYENLSEFLSLEYFSLRSENKSSGYWSSMDKDIEVDVNRLEDILDQSGVM